MTGCKIYFNSESVYFSICPETGVADVDYSAYPSPEFQRRWLRIYLETFHGTTELSGDNGITERDISCLYVQVNKFALAAHFLWAVWALIQAEHSTIDFDFLG